MVDGESVDEEPRVGVTLPLSSLKTPNLFVGSEAVEAISPSLVVESEIKSSREGINLVENDPSLKGREKFDHLRFAESEDETNKDVTLKLKAKASSFQGFVDSFKEGNLSGDSLNNAILKINEFMHELWDICAIESLASAEGKITFEQYKSVLESLGQEYRDSYSYKSFNAISLGSHERMKEAYEYECKAADDPEKTNLWNYIHCTCEAAIAVLSRTVVTTEGTEEDKDVTCIDGTKLHVKGAIEDIKERIAAHQTQIVYKDTPCGTSEWMMRILEALFETNSYLFQQESNSSKLLFLLRDISGKAIKFSIARFKLFFDQNNIGFKENDIKNAHNDSESIGKSLTFGNIELNFVKKDETENNGDPHTNTPVDGRVTMGLADYLSYAELVQSYERAIDVMADGATMDFGQFMKNHPSRKYMEIAMDWRLITRPTDRLLKTLNPIAIKKGVDLKIFYTPGAEKTQLLIRTCKPKKSINAVVKS